MDTQTIPPQNGQTITLNLNEVPEQIPDVQMQNRMALLLFAILQTIFGIGLIILDIITFSITGGRHALLYSIIGSGFWAGGFFTITGIFGLIASRHNTSRDSFRNHRCHLGIIITTGIVASITSLALTITVGVAFILKLTDRGRYTQYDPLGANLLIAHFAFYLLVSIFNIGQVIASFLNFCRLKVRADGITVYFKTEHVPKMPTSMSCPVMSQAASIPVSFSYPALVTVTSLQREQGMPPPYELGEKPFTRDHMI